MPITQRSYIAEIDPTLDSCYNHVALEAAIRAIEDDCGVPPYHLAQYVDIRLYGHLQSACDLSDLIRKGEFELDLIRTVPGSDTGAGYQTPYGRAVYRGFADGHRIIQSSKGKLVLDHAVHDNINNDLGD